MQLHSGWRFRQLMSSSIGPPVYLPLLTLSIYLFWRGYDYAISDQDEVLPYLFHLLDASLFQFDWFVNAQLETFGPRTLFVHITWLPAKLLGSYVTIYCIYVASWVATAQALYSLGLQLTRERLAATLCVIIALLLTPKFTLGSNDLVTWILTPSIPAWSLSLWGLVFFVRGQVVRSALFLGISVWIQALVGLQVLMICMLVLVWKDGLFSKRLYTFLGLFVIFALPALVPLIWYQLMQPNQESLLSYFYILFEFRAPHHYIPTSFDLQSVIRFACLVGFGLATIRLLDNAHRKLVLRALMIITIFCVLAFLGAEVWESDFITKLQLFKLTVLVKVFCVICVSNAIAKLILQFHRRLVNAFIAHSIYVLGFTLVIVGTLALLSPDALGIRPSETSVPKEKISEWARDSTSIHSIFAIPPGWGHFRSQAQRAIVVNFKAVPFHEPYMTQWYTRLLDMAPIDPPYRGGGPIISNLDSAYFSLTSQQIQTLSSKYGFEYIVRHDSSPVDDFETIYRVSPWTVLRINPKP